MIYVMSDLHGEYSLYRAMLDQIHLGEDDLLYVLGDVVDRGPQPMEILLDMMKRPNVILLAGNHEMMALSCLQFLMQEISEESLSGMDSVRMGRLLSWQQIGGQTTLDGFHRLNAENRSAVLTYLEEAELFEEVETEDAVYILVHAGLGHFAPDKPLWDYSAEDLLWTRPDYDTPYFTDDRFVITGHTPTQLIPENPRPGFLFQRNGHINIDCGCFAPGGRLCCLRLDDGKVFYTEHKA